MILLKHLKSFTNNEKATKLFKITMLIFSLCVTAIFVSIVPSLASAKEDSQLSTIDNNAANNAICAPSNFPINLNTNDDKFLSFTAIDADSSLQYINYWNEVNIYYSFDGQNWEEWLNESPISFSQTGQKVYLKGSNPDGFCKSSTEYTYFDMKGKFAAGGDIMSLIDNGECKTTEIPRGYCFYKCFLDCSSLATAPRLSATSLKNYCYSNMFDGCSSLKSAPELPATNLAHYCYEYMFFDCASLINSPILPATELKGGCYSHMFSGCSSLTKCSDLPAADLFAQCYRFMYSECISLAQAPVLNSTNLDENCYEGMFRSCTSLKQGPELPATELKQACYYLMFEDCTSLVEAPVLNSTNLADGCYFEMFKGCTSLEVAPALPATNLKDSCYRSMFYRCTSLKNAPELPAITISYLGYRSMFEGCISLKQAPKLPACSLDEGCYDGMFCGCTSLEQAPELPAKNLYESCYDAMFEGCISLKQVPELAATDLKQLCYCRMFKDCTSIEYPADISTVTQLGHNCCKKMYYGCSALKVFETNVNPGYKKEWKASSVTILGIDWASDMFTNTSGDFIGTPNLGATYYIQNPKANYTVNHYLQNIEDDDYSLKDTEILSGISGEQTNAQEKSYSGFYSQEIIQKEVSEDGSTVVDVRYDRIKSNVIFNSLGGSKVPSQQNIKYGANIIEPDNPLRDNYDFLDWCTDESCINSWDFANDTMPANDLILYAKWSVDFDYKANAKEELTLQFNSSIFVVDNLNNLCEADKTMYHNKIENVYDAYIAIIDTATTTTEVDKEKNDGITCIKNIEQEALQQNSSNNNQQLSLVSHNLSENGLTESNTAETPTSDIFSLLYFSIACIFLVSLISLIFLKSKYL